MLDLSSACAQRKRQIAQQFSKSAHRYDSLASVQQEIGADAILRVQPGQHRLVDIGCGTGHLTRQLAPGFTHTVAIDLAFGMLEHASQQADAEQPIHYITGDAEALPLCADSVDQVFSSMALQWCPDLSACFAEIYRVLKPGGTANLGIMSDGSMHELNHCWQQLGQAPRVNRFPLAAEMFNMAQVSGFSIHQRQQQYLSFHPDLLTLLNSIRRIGAGVVTAAAAQSAISRREFNQLESLYRQTFAEHHQLPLTYQVSFLELRKPL